MANSPDSPNTKARKWERVWCLRETDSKRVRLNLFMREDGGATREVDRGHVPRPCSQEWMIQQSSMYPSFIGTLCQAGHFTILFHLPATPWYGYR